MRCATSQRRYTMASHGRSSPRRRCRRAYIVDQSSWAACSNRWPCLMLRPRRRAVFAPGSALAAPSGLFVCGAVACPSPPLPGPPVLPPCSCPASTIPDHIPHLTPNPCSLAQPPVRLSSPPSPPPITRFLAPPPVRSSALLPRLRPAPSSFIPSPPLPPFLSPEASHSALAVHQFLLIMAPPGGVCGGSPIR